MRFLFGIALKLVLPCRNFDPIHAQYLDQEELNGGQ